MADTRKNPRSGGFAIALGALAGVLIGNAYDQLTIGLIGGIAAGSALSLALWLWDRRR